MKKRIGLFLVALLLLAGCDNKGKNNDSNTMSEAVSSTKEESAITPLGDQTLKLSMRKPLTLNPLINEDITVDSVLKLLFESLIIVDEYQKPVPNLAESFAFSEDGTTVTIKLKNNIKWHDGEEIKARDVEYSLDTIRNISSENAIYKANITNITSYNVLDEKTIQIIYSQPFVGSSYYLDFPIIPEHYYANNPDSPELAPVGSGAYKFSAFEDTKTIALKKNPEFLKEVALIDFVSVMISPDKETDLYSFDQNLTDVIKSDIVDWGKHKGSKQVDSREISTTNFDFVGFNFKKPLFKSKEIREVVAHSIHKSEILKTIYLNHADVAEVPINSAAWIYEPEIKTYSFDLEIAKDIIDALGFVENEEKVLQAEIEGTLLQLKIDILVNEENLERVQIADALNKNLLTLGIQSEIISLPFEEYNNKLKSGDYDIFVGGYNLSLIPDLTFMLHSSSIDSGSNVFFYSNELMDSLLSNVFKVTNEEQLKNNISELQKHISDELPCIGVVFRKSAIMTTRERIYGEFRPTINNIFNNANEWFIFEEESKTDNDKKETEVEQDKTVDNNKEEPKTE